MAYVGVEGKISQFHYYLKPQIRSYGQGILGFLPGYVEQNYVSLCTQSIDETTDRYNSEIYNLQAQITALDVEISKLLKEQSAFYNPRWDRIFRAGAEESYFAYQVDRFACIYMEKLSDLLALSPLNYFRANRRLLAHDLEF